MGRATFHSPDMLEGAYALVVDADKERRMLTTGILRYCGALVTPVETPDEALTIMRLLKPDVVVVDLSPPHAAAVAFVARVRALDPDDGGSVPVIAVGDGHATADAARAHGCDAHLARPLDPWMLCRAVADLLAP
jgi:CheY-like chemotaxis protein